MKNLIKLMVFICCPIVMYGQDVATVTSTPTCSNEGSIFVQLDESEYEPEWVYPFEYDWTNLDTGFGGAGITFNDNFGMYNLAPGEYEIVIILSDDCDLVVTVEIEEIIPDVITTVTNATSACDDGEITVEIEGYIPEHIMWSTGETTSTISNLGPGTYCVAIIDDDCGDFYECFEITCACFEGTVMYDFMSDGSVQDVVISIPDLVTPASVLIRLFDDTGAQVGGTQSISFPTSIATLEDLEIGAEYCIEYENFGCTQEYCFIVEGSTCPGLVEFEEPIVDYLNCGNADVFLDITNETGLSCIGGVFNQTWSDMGGMGAQRLDLEPGTYCSTVEYISGACNGCKVVKCVDVEGPEPVIILPVVTQISACVDWDAQVCRLVSGKIEMHIFGGFSNYMVEWEVTPEYGSPFSTSGLNVIVPYNKRGEWCGTVTDDCGNDFGTFCFDLDFQVILPLVDCDGTGPRRGFFKGSDDKEYAYDAEIMEAELIRDYKQGRLKDVYTTKNWTLERTKDEHNVDYALQSRVSKDVFLNVRLGCGGRERGSELSKQGGIIEINENLRTEYDATDIDLNISPVPAIDELKLEAYSSTAMETTVYLFNANGQLHSKYEWILNEGQNIKMIQLDDLSSGIYFVKINNLVAKRIVVLK